MELTPTGWHIYKKTDKIFLNPSGVTLFTYNVSPRRGSKPVNCQLSINISPLRG